MLELVYLSFKDHMPSTDAKVHIVKYLSNQTAAHGRDGVSPSLSTCGSAAFVHDPWARLYAAQGEDLWKYLTATVHTESNLQIGFIKLHCQLYRLLAKHRPVPKIKKVKGRHTDEALEDWCREQNELSELYERDLAFHPSRGDSWYAVL